MIGLRIRGRFGEKDGKAEGAGNESEKEGMRPERQREGRKSTNRGNNHESGSWYTNMSGLHDLAQNLVPGVRACMHISWYSGGARRAFLDLGVSQIRRPNVDSKWQRSYYKDTQQKDAPMCLKQQSWASVRTYFHLHS